LFVITLTHSEQNILFVNKISFILYIKTVMYKSTFCFTYIRELLKDP